MSTNATTTRTYQVTLRIEFIDFPDTPDDADILVESLSTQYMLLVKVDAADRAEARSLALAKGRKFMARQHDDVDVYDLRDEDCERIEPRQQVDLSDLLID